jgi:hypothetical protein
MRFDQLEFLKKQMQRAALEIWQIKPYVHNKDREKNELSDRVENIQKVLGLIASTAECFLGMLMDDMKVKDNPESQKPIEIQAKEEEPWKQEYGYEYGRTKEGNGVHAISLCIKNLEEMQIRLGDYVLHNRDFQIWTVEKMIYKVLEEMRLQSAVLTTALRHLMGKTPRTTVPIKDNNKVRQTPIRRSIHFNYQETDGREPLGDIELFHSYQVDELTSEFYKEMQVKALSQLREIEAKAGRYEILIWHGEKIAGTDTGTLVLLRKEPGI